jgi:WD40 repeat protein
MICLSLSSLILDLDGHLISHSRVSFLLKVLLYLVLDIFYYFQVCGLKWSPDGRYLASGGNDNMLYIWSVVAGQAYSQPQPLHSLR